MPTLSTLEFSWAILISKAVRHTRTVLASTLLIVIGAQHLANFSDDKRDEDGEGHGTHVAGTIGSRMQ